MEQWRRWFWQAVAYLVFLLPLVYLSGGPVLSIGTPDSAEIKLALRHAGSPIGECNTLRGVGTERLQTTSLPEGLCGKQRSPLQVRLTLDGELLLDREVLPTGWRGDGLSSMYANFVVPAGAHELELFMNDNNSQPESGWSLSESLELNARQVLVITFRDGFQLQ